MEKGKFFSSLLRKDKVYAQYFACLLRLDNCHTIAASYKKTYKSTDISNAINSCQ